MMVCEAPSPKPSLSEPVIVRDALGPTPVLLLPVMLFDTFTPTPVLLVPVTLFDAFTPKPALPVPVTVCDAFSPTPMFCSPDTLTPEPVPISTPLVAIVAKLLQMKLSVPPLPDRQVSCASADSGAARPSARADAPSSSAANGRAERGVL